MTSKRLSIELDEELELFDDCVIPITIKVTATLIYRKAKISGPPESCYPEEADIDIESVHIWDERGAAVTSVIAAVIEKRFMGRIEDKLWEDFHENDDHLE